MTIDDTTLTAALRDLAGTVTDEPGRLAQVHQRARRLRRRRHAAGAGVLAATLAAGLVGAQEIGGSGAGSRLVTPATSPPAGVPACTVKADSPPATGATTPPAIGQQTSGGGVVVGTPGPASLTVDVQAGPLAGSRLTLGVTSATSVFVASPDSTGETPAAASELRDGQVVKFTATRTGAQAYHADEIHAAPFAAGAAGGGSTARTTPAGPGNTSRTTTGGTGNIAGLAPAGPRNTARAAAGAGSTVRPAPGGAAPDAAAKVAMAPPAASSGFKAQGAVLATTAQSLTVRVDGGLASGTVTFTLATGAVCQPRAPHPGDRVLLAGTRTSAGTYQADIVSIAPPATSAPAPATPAKS